MSVKQRMKQVIAAKTRDRSRYVQLKEATSISGDIWKNFWFDRREPDGAMLEALSRAWPEYAYWLATGATDVTSGHLCPETAFCFEPGATPLVTADAFLKAGVEAASLVDRAFQTAPEDEEQIATAIHNFLSGGSVHRFPAKAHDVLDQAFKKIRAFNQIAKIRNKEAGMQSEE